MLPPDYTERVYAGVLGKIIGVYLGRPFEGWPHARILEELGEVTHYVNDRHDVALKHHLLVVPDDDISGTLVFARALSDHGLDPTPAQVGRTWLNYLVEDKAFLFWGGLGNSTEHTAYLRLKAGVVPPETGSIALNGTVVAEQVGAQIFVEGFAMTAPGDPERAADLAARAASVSHDGEALHAARVVAAMTSQAFVESDVDKLLDTATALIPAESLIRRVIDDVRRWQSEDEDWLRTRRHIEERYGYDTYGGNFHVVPNHAVVISAIAHSGGDFGRAMTVVTTSGWDTDSNGGNVGTVMGVLGGLTGLDAGVDWRGPVADRIYLPSADGGSAITDAVREAVTLANHGRRRHGRAPVEPKAGARFHFSLPGSVQGFTAEDPATTTLNNVEVDGHRHLRMTVRAPQRATASTAPTWGRMTTPTFIPPEATGPQIYQLLAAPTLSPGQRLRARVRADIANDCSVRTRLVIHRYDDHDELTTVTGPSALLAPGEVSTLSWTVPDVGGQPIADVGVEIAPEQPSAAAVLLDWLTWDGEPDVTLTRPLGGGTMWRRAWVNAVDRFDDRWPEPFRLVHNIGTGMLLHGSRDWRDYEVSADVTPHLATSVGLAARVQGMARHYMLELTGRDTVRLVRTVDTPTVLAELPFAWEYGRTYQLALRVVGVRLEAFVDAVLIFSHNDDETLRCGGIALAVTDGRSATTSVRVTPHTPTAHPERTLP